MLTFCFGVMSAPFCHAAGPDPVTPLITKLPGYTLSAAACKEIANTNNGGFEKVAVREITEVGAAMSFLAEYGLLDHRFAAAIKQAMVAQVNKPEKLSSKNARTRVKVVHELFLAMLQDGDRLVTDALESYRNSLTTEQRIEAFRLTDGGLAEKRVAVQAQMTSVRLMNLIAALKEQPDSRVASTLRSFAGLQFVRWVFQHKNSETQKIFSEKSLRNLSTLETDLYKSIFNLNGWDALTALGALGGTAMFAVTDILLPILFAITDGVNVAVHHIGKTWEAVALPSLTIAIPSFLFCIYRIRGPRLGGDPSTLMSAEFMTLMGLDPTKVSAVQIQESHGPSHGPKETKTLSMVSSLSSLRGQSLRDVSYLSDFERGLMQSIRESIEISSLETRAKIQTWDQLAIGVLDSTSLSDVPAVALNEAMREFVRSYGDASEMARGLNDLESLIRESVVQIKKIKSLPFQDQGGVSEPQQTAVAELLNARLQTSLKTIEEFSQYAETIRVGRTRYIDAANKIDSILKSKTLSSDTSLSEWHEIASEFREQLERVLK